MDFSQKSVVGDGLLHLSKICVDRHRHGTIKRSNPTIDKPQGATWSCWLDGWRKLRHEEKRRYDTHLQPMSKHAPRWDVNSVRRGVHITKEIHQRSAGAGC